MIGSPLTRASLLVRDLVAGNSVIACRAALQVRHAYWLVRPENQNTTVAIATVCDWLRQLACEMTECIKTEVLQGVTQCNLR